MCVCVVVCMYVCMCVCMCDSHPSVPSQSTATTLTSIIRSVGLTMSAKNPKLDAHLQFDSPFRLYADDMKRGKVVDEQTVTLPTTQDNESESGMCVLVCRVLHVRLKSNRWRQHAHSLMKDSRSNGNDGGGDDGGGGSTDGCTPRIPRHLGVCWQFCQRFYDLMDGQNHQNPPTSTTSKGDLPCYLLELIIHKTRLETIFAVFRLIHFWKTTGIPCHFQRSVSAVMY